jgi:hypothetical protein
MLKSMDVCVFFTQRFVLQRETKTDITSATGLEGRGAHEAFGQNLDLSAVGVTASALEDGRNISENPWKIHGIPQFEDILSLKSWRK